MAFAAFCALCAFLSKPGHFDVNGCSDECASFYKVLHCLRAWAGGGRMGTVFIYAAYTHKAGEPMNAVLFPRQLLFVELEFPTVKFFFPPPTEMQVELSLKGAALAERRAKNGPLGNAAVQIDLPRR